MITFCTGGSPEIIDETCGMVIPYDDVDALETAVRHACEEKLFLQEACLSRSKLYDAKERFAEYVQLYQEIGCKS